MCEREKETLLGDGLLTYFVNLKFFSQWTEGKLLQIASHIERLGRVRRSPRWALESVEVKEYLQDVPVIVPDAGNVNLQAYPLGTLYV